MWGYIVFVAGILALLGILDAITRPIADADDKRSGERG